MSLRVEFVPRDDPLAPEAAAAVGRASRRLGERLLAMEEERLSRLRGVAGSDLLLVLGDPDSLPWVDEIAYLGRDPGAPRLLLPTALRPDVPVSLFERALFAQWIDMPIPSFTMGPQAAPNPGPLRSPVAVLPRPRRVVSVAGARRIDRALLEAWVSRCA